MASAAPVTKNFASHDLKDKLKDLERRANGLQKEYDCLLERAAKLEELSKTFAGKVHYERRLVNLIEVLATPDKRSDKLLDYVTLFFNVVIAKMRFRGAEIQNMKDLWYQSADEDIMEVFTVTLKGLGFVDSDIVSTKMILDLVYQRDDSNLKVDKEMISNDPTTPPNSPVKSTDPEVQKILLFLQVQEDLDSNFKRVLRLAVATAHSTVQAAKQSDKTMIRFLNFQPSDDALFSNAQSFQHTDSVNYCLMGNSTSGSEENCGSDQTGNERCESHDAMIVEAVQQINCIEIVDKDTSIADNLPTGVDNIGEVGISDSSQTNGENITENLYT